MIPTFPRLVWFLAAATAVLSLWYSFEYRIPPAVDARAYHEIAQNLLAGRGYREELSTPLPLDYAIARVGPGYEFFLAGVYAITGPRPEAAWILQSLFQAGAVLLVFALGRRILRDTRAATAAAALVAFSPELIQATSMLLTETLAMLLLLAALWFSIRESRTIGRDLGTGILWGAALLVRSPFLFAFAGALVYLASRRHYRSAAISVFIVALMFTPWVLRNLGVYGRALPFGAAGGQNLWVGNYGGASGELDVPRFIQQFKDQNGPVATDQHGREAYWRFIRTEPLSFIKLQGVKSLKFVSVLRPSAFWPHLSGSARLIMAVAASIWTALAMTAGLAGVIAALLRWNTLSPSVRLLATCTVLIPLGVIPFVIETRYRFPVYPFLALCAGFFFASGKSDRRVLYLPLAMAAFLVVAGSAVDLMVNLAAFRMYLSL